VRWREKNRGGKKLPKKPQDCKGKTISQKNKKIIDKIVTRRYRI
jgi:hypothetical protein